MDALERLHKSGIVPVVAIENADDAVPTAQALLDGGIDVMEITYRTAAAPECIRRVLEECPDMLVGAGTVINKKQCEEAIALGCRFIVSPGFDDEVVSLCIEKGIAVTPGCVTPTEIMKALKYDLHVVKFFPAGVYGGMKAVKALAGPFGGNVKFIPTGGVSQDNLEEYISSSYVHAVGGTWICRKEDIINKQFSEITQRCVMARKAIEAHR